MTTSTGTFDLSDWQEDTFDRQPGAHLARVSSRKTYRGGLEGESTLTMLSVGVPAEGSAEFQGVAYVALERVTGRLDGRRGGFVLLHVADRTVGMKVSVVAGSADGELTGLTGELAITRADDGTHTYALTHQLP
jgi:hypothetical protein